MPSKTLVLARRGLLALSVLAASATLPAATHPALAYDEASSSAVNIDKRGIALRGHDPVAYFTLGKPTLGSGEFTAKHDGAIYHFASAANRDAFQSDPARYAPAFGGFCAMGASLEKKFDGDPELWRIVDGKLYVNVAPAPHKRWLEDIPGNISRANQNWPAIKDRAPKDL